MATRKGKKGKENDLKDKVKQMKEMFTKIMEDQKNMRKTFDNMEKKLMSSVDKSLDFMNSIFEEVKLDNFEV